MSETDEKFSVKLRSGQDKDTLAYLICYGRAFKGGRFVYPTGIKVPRKGFNEARPGRQIAAIKRLANGAYNAMLDEGASLNSVSLRNRIDLFRNSLQWIGDELHVVNGDRVEKYLVPDGVDREDLATGVKGELVKAKPQVKKLIEKTISGGSNELFGFWEDVLSGKIKPRNGKSLRKSTIRSKRQSLRAVREFRPTANFEGMDRKFYNDFMAWMREQEYDENTCGKNIKKHSASGIIE